MSSHPQAQVTSDRLLQIAWCFVQPLAIDSAAQNRVFDVLDAGPKTLDEVSKETGASARGLAAVMNLLVGIDLLAKSADGRYSLTPESATFLVSAKPGYMGAFLHLVPSTLAANFLKLPEIMRTGEPFEGGAERPEVAAEFFDSWCSISCPWHIQPRGLLRMRSAWRAQRSRCRSSISRQVQACGASRWHKRRRRSA